MHGLAATTKTEPERAHPRARRGMGALRFALVLPSLAAQIRLFRWSQADVKEPLPAGTRVTFRGDGDAEILGAVVSASAGQ